MSSLDSSGSRWRRWDLHVHIPGTHLSDGYRKEDSAETVDEAFCRRLWQSDVDAFGITDYFDATNILRIINMYRDRYGESKKLMVPNVELRLTDVVNKDDHFVNYHLLFNPSLPGDRVIDFVRRIPIEVTDTASGRNKECGELTVAEYPRATVNRRVLLEHARKFFGDRAPSDSRFLTLVPAGNDGIRPQPGSARRAQLAREIEAGTDGIFGNNTDRSWYLRIDRNEDSALHSPARPVFKGSDAHSFEQFDERHQSATVGSHTTWIKADLTYEGLRQTLLEPAERVRIQHERPDQKQPFKWIDRVIFSPGSSFPEEVQLNENLNSIIGSRSSGKSALLAHIAHAVAPDETERALEESKLAGPAAGVDWFEASKEGCVVEWAAPETRRGKVIYVPQNTLYALSERPQEITNRIRPLIDSRFNDHGAALLEYENSLTGARESIRGAVDSWFVAHSAATTSAGSASNVGDEDGIRATIVQLNDTLQSNVTEVDEDRVSRFTSALSAIDTRRQTAAQLLNTGALQNSIQVRIHIEPDVRELPDELTTRLSPLLETATHTLSETLNQILTEFAHHQQEVAQQTSVDERLLREQYSDVVAGLVANEAAGQALRERRNLERKLAEIEQLKAQIAGHEEQMLRASGRIRAALEFVNENRSHVTELFKRSAPTVDGMKITVESGFTVEAERLLAQGVNKSRDSRFVSRGEGVKIEEVQESIHEFLLSLASGQTALNAGVSLESVAVNVLLIHRELRLVAELDGDRIGGFESSSMTPGKQALFALTLLLGEDGDGWPLLLDQPEDDLDNRSIYDQLVPYLLKRKRERQIIMVSHNANLVVGADSECVIVANRHGSDRPNYRERTFDYRSGALENSFSRPTSQTTLDRQGVREHVCQLLDGGPEAFQRRSQKYRLQTP